jgi:hypothetical protein
LAWRAGLAIAPHRTRKGAASRALRPRGRPPPWGKCRSSMGVAISPRPSRRSDAAPRAPARRHPRAVSAAARPWRSHSSKRWPSGCGARALAQRRRSGVIGQRGRGVTILDPAQFRAAPPAPDRHERGRAPGRGEDEFHARRPGDGCAGVGRTESAIRAMLIPHATELDQMLGLAAKTEVIPGRCATHREGAGRRRREDRCPRAWATVYWPADPWRAPPPHHLAIAVARRCLVAVAKRRPDGTHVGLGHGVVPGVGFPARKCAQTPLARRHLVPFARDMTLTITFEASSLRVWRRRHRAPG